jgi:hypothetical protein
VKHTFVDVEDDEDLPMPIRNGVQLTASNLKVFDLPAAQFKTTPEFDEWRREYRKFRLGFFKGAKGEASSPKGASSCPLDIQSISTRYSDCLEANSDASDSDNFSRRPTRVPSDQSTVHDSDEGVALNAKEDVYQQTPSRAMKRQRQRERRRMGKAIARGNFVGLAKTLNTSPEGRVPEHVDQDAMAILSATYRPSNSLDWWQATFQEQVDASDCGVTVATSPVYQFKGSYSLTAA